MSGGSGTYWETNHECAYCINNDDKNVDWIDHDDQVSTVDHEGADGIDHGWYRC